MSKQDSVLNDIKSGKGLSPLKSQSQNSAPNKGLTKENRGQDTNGFRIDQFTLREDSKKGS